MKNARAFFIRLIGPAAKPGWESGPQTRRKLPRDATFRVFDTSFQTFLPRVLQNMESLTESRLATESNQLSIAPLIIEAFDPEIQGYPIRPFSTSIKSLFLRIPTTITPCFFERFPELEVINLFIHGEIDNDEITAAKKMRHLKILSLYKAGNGWSVNDITKLATSRFDCASKIEHLFMEGWLDLTPIKSFIQPLKAFTSLKKLAITDEQWVPLDSQTNRIESKTSHPLNHSRDEVARAFFHALPTLKELCIGSQITFSASVYARDELAGPSSVRVVRIRNRCMLPPKWTARDPVPANNDDDPDPQDYCLPDSVDEYEDLRFYPEMRWDNCDTSFWDVEWLRAIRLGRGGGGRVV
ncbi:hypothetical protein B0H63DRAFT_464073 [Podospora didyma]|uniref:Uncharacterized protein n=1 Tax=Podospora didyma TaxID=330526 RepID=A0AAE0NY01_9PEZI|nr:hypothetical protein B0H63DRAFT_464073 [Podospora didyma]